jgi:hypothetical protein
MVTPGAATHIEPFNRDRGVRILAGMPTSFRAALAVCTLGGVLFAACAEPPLKEMNQAQGAIDAAKAAGAQEYAAEELRAATDAMRRAEEAVEQRDYRLALNSALDSRERAQTAARNAADGKARARGRAEGLVAEVTTALAAATDRLKNAEAARVPRTATASLAADIKAAQDALQEAGTALGREDYRKAAAVLEGHAARLRASTSAIDRVPAARGPRQGRGRR